MVWGEVEGRREGCNVRFIRLAVNCIIAAVCRGNLRRDVVTMATFKDADLLFGARVLLICRLESPCAI
jgi:hypothetical protein